METLKLLIAIFFASLFGSTLAGLVLFTQSGSVIGMVLGVIILIYTESKPRTVLKNWTSKMFWALGITATIVVFYAGPQSLIAYLAILIIFALANLHFFWPGIRARLNRR